MAFEFLSTGPVGGRELVMQHEQQVEVGYSGDGGAARDAAVEVGAVQLFAEGRGDLRPALAPVKGQCVREPGTGGGGDIAAPGDGQHAAVSLSLIPNG